MSSEEKEIKEVPESIEIPDSTTTPTPSPSPKTPKPEDQKITILQLARWLVNSIDNTKFLLKPEDLRVLYIITLWEYIKNYHFKGDFANTSAIETDREVALTQKELMQIVTLFYDKNYYPNFMNTLHI